MLSNEMIAELEGKGFKRWTKNGMDRLYINAAALGLDCEYHNTGSIRRATFNGSLISNCEARRMKGSKTYINVANGTVVSDNDTLRAAAAELMGAGKIKVE